jgi:hypothetical protein
LIAGHFGLSAIVKARSPYVPLWALMLATVWLDVVFVPLFLTGIETIDSAPGTHGGYGTGIIHANYTHSIVGALALSGMFGYVAYRLWGRRCGLILGAVVMSHWLLDLIVHRADLPLLPGNAGGLPTLGFGLWRYPGLSAVAELTLVVAGACLYWRAARLLPHPRSERVRYRAATVAILILVSGCGILFLDVTNLAS